MGTPFVHNEPDAADATAASKDFFDRPEPHRTPGTGGLQPIEMRGQEGKQRQPPTKEFALGILLTTSQDW
jgi:hypothetical protein